ncbi:MAG: hypothetical protein A3J59_01445 [Candidatus Buchananbacteria bacterium RIFCSPHIGHO2_02_FULL_56_16]|uniref:Methyltransferase type 11 domain-containing protein n=1 Tax=Candidatus Buchananbacteria bacterium RIFCSPHIGHO2_02_FULL_56_16 TaxID=1797542 RepID=A0A1G1YFN2_9BACT|nr:MAG: hypothetical protein A3J59_01445 [Candidatus Buchananbacteria bacterium RIFCSPHIGHO2_02_FULL_56_16]
MREKFRDQRDLWEAQHENRKVESERLENTPNLFAKQCVDLLPENGIILEAGAANGRDARFFAKEKKL